MSHTPRVKSFFMILLATCFTGRALALQASVPVGTTAATEQVTFSFRSTVTLHAMLSTAIQVVTQGTPNLDFNYAAGGTCATGATYRNGESCTVNYTFAPIAPGLRMGAVVLVDASGASVVGRVLVSGSATATGTASPETFPAGTAATVLNTGLNHPSGVAADAAGNVYVADTWNGMVRAIVATNGHIPQNPTIRNLGASFRSPTAVAIDGAGDVYVTDSGTNAVYEMMDVAGAIPSSREMRTLGSNFQRPSGVAVDGAGNVYVADSGNNAVKKILASNGDVITLGGGFNNPHSVAIDGAGNVFVGDTGSDAVKKIPAGCVLASCVVTLGSGFRSPEGVAVDGAGRIYVADTGNSAVKEIEATGGSTRSVTLSSGLVNPRGVAIVGAGKLYAVDSSANQVTEIAPLAAQPAGVTPSIVIPPVVVPPPTAYQARLDSVNPNAVPILSLDTPITLTGDWAPLDGGNLSHVKPLLDGIPLFIISNTHMGSSSVMVALADGAHISAPGRHTVQVAQFDSAQYFSGLLPFYVGASGPGITFPQPASPTVRGAVSVLTASSNSGLPVSYSVVSGPAVLSGSFITYTDVGTVVVQADEVADQYFPPAPPVQRSITVTATQSVAPITVTVTITNAGTLGTIYVLTTGQPLLDFQLASGGTCATGTAYAANASCTVNYTFTPLAAGQRMGAVQLVEANGTTILGTTLISGTGIGAALVFPGAGPVTLVGNSVSASSLTVDAAGNIFVTDKSVGRVLEIMAVGGRVPANPVIRTLIGNRGGVNGIALDGAGDVYFSSSSSTFITELVAIGGVIPANPELRQLGTFFKPKALAVNAAGAVYVLDTVASAVFDSAIVNFNGPQFHNIFGGLAVDAGGNGYVTEDIDHAVTLVQPGLPGKRTLTSSFSTPVSVAVDAAGNVYVGDFSTLAVSQIQAVNGVIPATPVITTLGSGSEGPAGIAVDGAGNVYFADRGAGVKVLPLSTPPSLTFPPTVVGTSSAPQTVTLQNIGTAAAFFPVPTAGTIPSVSANFVLGASSTCPQVSAGARTGGFFAPGSCTLSVIFTPSSAGTITGALTLGDNSPAYGGGHVFALSGSAINPLPVLTGISPASAPRASADTTITLTGTSFQSTSIANFDGVPIATVFLNATQLTAIVPAAMLTVNGAHALTVVTPAPGGGTSAAQAFTVIGLPQTITFLQTATVAQGTSATLTATSTSGLPVTFSVVSGSAILNGSTVTFTAAGSVVLEADQVGDATYAPALPVQQTIYVAPMTQRVGSTSAVQTSSLTFNTAGTLGTINVLTTGQPLLDFQRSGGTCSVGTIYALNAFCTVTYTFTPKAPGQRLGAVQLLATDGATILATNLLTGTGTGAAVVFPGNTTMNILGSGFSGPQAVATDTLGNVYVADTYNNRIQEIMAVGGSIPASPTIRTLGSGFNSPTGVAVDGAGNVYVANFYTNLVNEIIAVGGSIPANPTIRTLGSGFNNPVGVAVDFAGNVYVGDYSNHALKELIAVNGSMPANPTIVTLGSNLGGPTMMALDSSGNIFVTDTLGSHVWEIIAVNGSIPASPTILSLGSGFTNPRGVAVDAGGNVYVADVGSNLVKELVAVGGSVPANPTILNFTGAFNAPLGLGLDAAGNIFVADTNNNTIKEVSLTQPSLSFASTAVGSTSSDSPQSVAVQNIGNATLNIASVTAATNFSVGVAATTPCLATLVADGICNLAASFTPVVAGTLSGAMTLNDNAVSSTQTVSLGGVTTQSAQTITFPQPLTLVAPGTIITLVASASSGLAVTYAITGGTGSATLNGSLLTCQTLGTVLITASQSGNAQYSAAPTVTDTVTILAIPPTIFFAVPNHYVGDAAFTVAASSNSAGAFTYGVVSGPATIIGTTLTLTGPGRVVLQASQSATITYTAGTSQTAFTIGQGHGSVWLANSNGTVSEFDLSANPLSSVSGYTDNISGLTQSIAFDNAGNLVIAGSSGVSIVPANGTAASSPSSAGGIVNPTGLAVDGAGAVWVANGNSTLSILGITPSTGFTGGLLSSPSALAIDPAGNVWLTNKGNNSVTEFLGAASPR